MDMKLVEDLIEAIEEDNLEAYVDMLSPEQRNTLAKDLKRLFKIRDEE